MFIHPILCGLVDDVFFPSILEKVFEFHGVFFIEIRKEFNSNSKNVEMLMTLKRKTPEIPGLYNVFLSKSDARNQLAHD